MLKKLFFKNLALPIFLIIFIVGPAHAQEGEKVDHEYRSDRTKNEVSFNVFNILIFVALEASYERLLNPQSSISLELFSKKLNKNEGGEVDSPKYIRKNFH